jgi:hypothetical protein
MYAIRQNTETLLVTSNEVDLKEKTEKTKYYMFVINTTNLIHTLLSLSLLFRFKASTCFGHHFPISRMHYTNLVLVSVVC